MVAVNASAPRTGRYGARIVPVHACVMFGCGATVTVEKYNALTALGGLERVQKTRGGYLVAEQPQGRSTTNVVGLQVSDACAKR